MLIRINQITFSFFPPDLEPCQKQASTLICCHHLQMPTLLIFGIKVSPLCCLCGVDPLWSPDQSLSWPQVTLTDSQATKERESDSIYLVNKDIYSVVKLWVALVFKGLTESGRLLTDEDNNFFSMWLRLREKWPEQREYWLSQQKSWSSINLRKKEAPWALPCNIIRAVIYDPRVSKRCSSPFKLLGQIYLWKAVF